MELVKRVDGEGVRGGGWYFFEAFVKPASGAFDVPSVLCIEGTKFAKLLRYPLIYFASILAYRSLDL